MIRVGVLALQGAFAEHIASLRKLGVEPLELRQPADLNQSFDGLILPGGESTVMGKLLRELDMFKPLKQRIQAGLPVFATCAGLILLAERAENQEKTYFELMDITVRRNAYGRQLGSFRTTAQFDGIGPIPMIFIRAPYISQVGPKARTLAEVDGNIVAARQNHLVCTAFHPELSSDLSVHNYFLDMIREATRTNASVA